MKTLIGYLKSVSGELFFFECDNGEQARIVFNGEHSTPINKKIALTVSESSTADTYEVTPSGTYFAYLEDDVAYDNVKLLKKHIALFRQVYPTESAESVQEQLDKAKILARKLQDHYRWFARHKWDVQVRAYTLVSECSAINEFCQTDIQNYIRDNDMDGFEPNYFHNWYRTGSPKHCGMGLVYDAYSSTYEGCNIGTMTHELGHNFGLRHANTKNLNGDSIEYNDTSCVMGRSHNMPGLNSPNLQKLKLEEDVKIVDYSQQVLICPTGLTRHAMHEDENQNVILRTTRNDDVYLSIRKDRGFPYHPDSRDGNVLYVHKRSSDNKTQLYHSVKPGESVKINGVLIKYLEYDNEIARVNLEFNDGKTISEKVIPLDFPEKMEAMELDERHNGLWYNKDFNGQGFDVQIKGGRMVVYWYTFNEGESSRRFYFGTCDVADGTERFDIYTSDDGTFADPTLSTSTVVGRGQLYFFDDTHGVFNYNMHEYGRGSTEITPVALSNNEMNGLWYTPSRNGEGFSMQFFDHLNSCTAYWYTYGPKPRYGSHRGIQKQRWFVCHGTKKTDAEYRVTIYEVRNGKWLFFDDVDVTPVGTATLTISDTNNIVFEYNIDAEPEVSGDGTFNLTRLF